MIFEALGDPVRRQLLQLLAGGELTTGELVGAVRPPISQPAVSQHLKVLREAGLVVARAEGVRRYYSVDAASVEQAREWLAGVLDPLQAAAGPLEALATEVARGKRARRRAPQNDEESVRSRRQEGLG